MDPKKQLFKKKLIRETMDPYPKSKNPFHSKIIFVF
jgi:hypothetical protein